MTRMNVSMPHAISGRPRLGSFFLSRLAFVTAAFWAWVSLGAGIELVVRDVASGSSQLNVIPGTEITYELTAELTANDTQGLAFIVLNLASSGGTLGSTQSPMQMPMLQFMPPLGFSQNPSGYGGTPQGTWIEQIGGAQNVFSHGTWACTDNQDCPDPSTCDGDTCSPIADLPTGTLLTDVAQPGNPVTIISGTWTAPMEPGIYTISVSRVSATAVRLTATGEPFWATEDCPLESITDLTIIVGSITEIPTLSRAGVLMLVFCLFCIAIAMGRRTNLRVS